MKNRMWRGEGGDGIKERQYKGEEEGEEERVVMKRRR